MSIELSPCAAVQVAPPVLPEVHMSVPAVGVVTVPIAGPRGAPGPSGSAVDTGQVKLTVTASANLAGHRAVTQLADATIEYADNTELAHLHAPIWVTTGAVASGGEVEVIAYGTLTEPSWSWTPRFPLYLGANGVITQNPPSLPGALFLAPLGVATGPTAAFIDRQPSILLI